MIKKLIKDIIKGERGFNKGEGISPESEGIPQKARVSPIPLLRGRRRIWIAPTSRSEFLNLLFTIIHI